MIILCSNCSPLQRHRPSLLWSLRMHPSWVCDLFALSQVWAKHSSGWWGSPTLSYQEKKCRVTGYFPGTQGGESVSISPWPFSGPNGGQLHHYLLPVTSLLGNLYSTAASLFFHLSACPSDIFYPARTEYHPPLSRRSYSCSPSIFSSAVYTDLSVSIAPLQMCN